MTGEYYPIDASAMDYIRRGKKVPPGVHEQAMKDGRALGQLQEHEEEAVKPLFPEAEVKRNPW